MKKEATNENKLVSKKLDDKKITRKEAIRKTGYVALSAATMMLLLGSPAKGSTTSSAPDSLPNW